MDLGIDKIVTANQQLKNRMKSPSHEAYPSTVQERYILAGNEEKARILSLHQSQQLCLYFILILTQPSLCL